ncbi:Alpha/Beta hydrolase protein [Melampsora americana]|nr:Alpha/Beta hydrolase protein [Melampsora americana]
MRSLNFKNDQKTLTLTEEFENKYGSQLWVCPEDQSWYYRQTNSPNDHISIFTSVFLNPFLESIGLRSSPSDPTFGRYTLPFSPYEKLIRENSSLTCWDVRVFLDHSGKSIEEESDRWVWYQVWWNETAAAKTGVKTDLCYCHGLSGYGGEFSLHAKSFLDAGYRVILPDLPSHGKSTGLHCHLNDLKDLAHAVQVVLTDVIKRDAAVGFDQRNVIVGGQSMGGFTAILYALLYHTPNIPGRILPSSGPTPKVLGILPLCPLLAFSPETRPHFIVERLIRVLRFFAGRLPLMLAYKGQSSEDRWYEDRYESDPKTYHGKLRVSTGLAALESLVFTDKYMSEIMIPFRVIHGDSDRVTSVNGSKKLFKLAKSDDKELIICPRTEHIILRVGRDEVDDEKRQVMISEMIKWIERITQTYS